MHSILVFYIFVEFFFSAFAPVKCQQLDRQQIQSYTSCQSDRDCKDNAFCFGNDDNKMGKCKCENGYDLIRNSSYYECLKGVKLGEACDQDIQCAITASKLAICNENKICECSPETQQAANDICYIIVGLTEICLSDNNCYLGDGRYGYCSSGRCACPLGERPSQNKTHCISVKKIGEKCILDEECVHQNTRCSDVCRCKADYVLSRNGTRCIKAATAFGESCTYDGQCSTFLTNSICMNETCTCRADQHQYAIRCVQSKKVGEYCTEDLECMYEPQLKNNVKCDGASCVCLYGKTSNGTCNIEKQENSSSIANYSVYYIMLLNIIPFFLML